MGAPVKKKCGGRSPKARGSGYEREIAKYLTEQLGIDVTRTPMSGAATFGSKIGGADLMGLPYIHAELKRTERLNLRDAMRQAEHSIAASSLDHAPTVITRKDREATCDSIVAMRLSDWLHLYRSFLREQGLRVDGSVSLQATTDTFDTSDHPFLTATATR